MPPTYCVHPPRPALPGVPQSKLRLVQALVEERAARILAQQEGESDAVRLALQRDEGHTLDALRLAVHELEECLL